MRRNLALANQRSGGVTSGPTVVYDSPDLVEQIAHLGFDWVWVDWQHGQFSEQTLNNSLARFLGTTTAPLVRVKSHEPGTINRVLDMGAMEVIVPMVQSAAQARAVVECVYYPPLGHRSAGGVRLGLLGESGMAEYLARANDEILLAVMVETEEAIANIDSILEVPEVDVVIVGPGDLRLDVTAHGHDEAHHERLVLQVAEAARRTGTVAGYVCQAKDMAERRIAQGFRFISYMSDNMALMAGMREMLSVTRRW